MRGRLPPRRNSSRFNRMSQAPTAQYPPRRGTVNRFFNLMRGSGGRRLGSGRRMMQRCCWCISDGRKTTRYAPRQKSIEGRVSGACGAINSRRNSSRFNQMSQAPTTQYPPTGAASIGCTMAVHPTHDKPPSGSPDAAFGIMPLIRQRGGGALRKSPPPTRDAGLGWRVFSAGRPGMVRISPRPVARLRGRYPRFHFRGVRRIGAR